MPNRRASILDASPASGLLAVLPCSLAAILAAQAIKGTDGAAAAIAVVMLCAAMLFRRAYRRGYWNTVAIACLFGALVGFAVGIIRSWI